MRLKPNISTNVAMILGGSVIALLGLSMWRMLGGYLGLVPGLFGVLGVGWVYMGFRLIFRRNELAITIDGSGIGLPGRKGRRTTIARDDIESISRTDTFKGRFVQVTTRTGQNAQVNVRQYCSIDEFLLHCRNQGLPVMPRPD